jgi:hypothetical protein
MLLQLRPLNHKLQLQKLSNLVVLISALPFPLPFLALFVASVNRSQEKPV